MRRHFDWTVGGSSDGGVLLMGEPCTTRTREQRAKDAELVGPLYARSCPFSVFTAKRTTMNVRVAGDAGDAGDAATAAAAATSAPSIGGSSGDDVLSHRLGQRESPYCDASRKGREEDDLYTGMKATGTSGDARAALRAGGLLPARAHRPALAQRQRQDTSPPLTST